MVRSASESEVARNHRLIERLECAWKRSDALFDMVRETSVREQPVELRHPVIFYMGHVSASAWNHYGRPVLERESPRPEFDGLFDDDGTTSRAPADWPSIREVRGYCDGIRSAFRSGAEDLARRSVDHPLATEGQVFRLVLEHELSHHELLLNLFQELDLGYKQRPEWWSAPRLGAAKAEPGFVTLRGERGAFELGTTPVTIGEYERFVDDDGYEDPRFWTPADWAWREESGQALPKDWVVRNGRRYVRTMFDRIALDEVGGWPVGVAPAEARAYARWKGARLPEPEELLVAAQGAATEKLIEAAIDRESAASLGNFGFRNGSPTPVGAFPEGTTRDGVHDLLGNGWDLAGNGATTTLFGGSWATDAALVSAARGRDHDTQEPVPFTQFRLAR